MDKFSILITLIEGFKIIFHQKQVERTKMILHSILIFETSIEEYSFL